MRKISFNIDASEQDFAETVDALDAVLFSACMYYLDVKDRGVLDDTDSFNILQVRFLLEKMRKTLSQ